MKFVVHTGNEKLAMHTSMKNRESSFTAYCSHSLILIDMCLSADVLGFLHVFPRLI